MTDLLWFIQMTVFRIEQWWTKRKLRREYPRLFGR